MILVGVRCSFSSLLTFLSHSESRSTSMGKLNVLIVGAGLGGLSCAIGCLREDLSVTVLERDAELTEASL